VILRRRPAKPDHPVPKALLKRHQIGRHVGLLEIHFRSQQAHLRFPIDAELIDFGVDFALKLQNKVSASPLMPPP
jgi:hypothetical protein